MTTYLITGGAGFIGSHLADLLLGQEHGCRVLIASTSEVNGKGSRLPFHQDGGGACPLPRLSISSANI